MINVNGCLLSPETLVTVTSCLYVKNSESLNKNLRDP